MLHRLNKHPLFPSMLGSVCLLYEAFIFQHTPICLSACLLVCLSVCRCVCVCLTHYHLLSTDMRAQANRPTLVHKHSFSSYYKYSRRLKERTYFFYSDIKITFFLYYLAAMATKIVKVSNDSKFFQAFFFLLINPCFCFFFFHFPPEKRPLRGF